MSRNYWLFKTEPGSFNLTDLKASPQQTTCWDGVRNYQARNLLRDGVRCGDGVLFYHSRVQPMAVVGSAKVVREAYADPSQFIEHSKYFDPAATKKVPRWCAVDICFEKEFVRPVTLQHLRLHPGLQGLALLHKGSRLSVQPVSAAHWHLILQLARDP
jgi:predicted RNA-binding protein with PUA-like domain